MQKQQPKLLVMADDFTGALDTGVQFSAKAIATLITTQTGFSLADSGIAADVLVVDLESRHLDPEAAYRATYPLAKSARENGIKHVYIKTDSTLRGNIGSECKAVLDAWETASIMFVPAYPKMGRTTLDGRQYVDGIRLDESKYAEDFLNPVFSSRVEDILSSQFGTDYEKVGVDDLPDHDYAKQNTVFIFDAVSDSDMQEIGSCLQARDALTITAGCAGFAEYLAELISFDKTSGGKLDCEKNTLILCGSVNDVSLKQMDEASAAGMARIVLSSEQTFPAFWEGASGNDFVEQLARQLRHGQPVGIQSVASGNQAISAIRAEETARSFGCLVESLLAKGLKCNLMVIGGDTAIGIIREIGISILEPVKEIMPGVPISKLPTRYGELVFISKAGGFGKVDVLIKILDKVKENERRVNWYNDG